MNMSEVVLKLTVDKLCIFLISCSRLTKSNDIVNVKALVFQIQRSKGRHGCSHTVSCDQQLRIRVFGLQIDHRLDQSISDRFISLPETQVDLAPFAIICLNQDSICTFNPIYHGNGSSESYNDLISLLIVARKCQCLQFCAVKHLRIFKLRKYIRTIETTPLIYLLIRTMSN